MQDQEKIARRCRVIAGHYDPESGAPESLSFSECAATTPEEKPDRATVLKWNGWGYGDTAFKMNPQGVVELTGKRYLFSGHKLPFLRGFIEQVVGVDIDNTTPTGAMPKLPEPNINAGFIAEVKEAIPRVSFDEKDRLLHSHGHTAQELHRLRHGALERYPDVVLYPTCHAHCEAIVRAAQKHNVCLIPYGGGTSVSLGLLIPLAETRMVVSVDMVKMGKILWIDRTAMVVRIEAGAVGVDIQAALEKEGLTIGHEPDSVEFSTLGGWISTRASGMKKNVYGNMEDILVSVRIVTPLGTFEKGCSVPRMSSGPDLHHIILGSEGTMGIITEATLKLRPVPQSRIYGSIVFPNFESGVAALHEVSKARCAPASIRLVDNEQFLFGQALKEEPKGQLSVLTDKFKKFYVTQWHGFDPKKMVACTLMFEGTPEEVERQQAAVYGIASKFHGLKGGEENGLRGYMLTFMIAYLRDLGLEYGMISESFETSIPWNNILPMCEAVKAVVRKSARAQGVKKDPFVSCRVTQLYDTGVCVYFYFAFLTTGLKDPVATFDCVEHDARVEIMKHGGSVSHHHGIGKLRKEFMEETVTPTGLTILRGIKHTIDPQNIFGSGNVI